VGNTSASTSVFVLIGLKKVLVLELTRCQDILRRGDVNVAERQRETS
jgi:hypothetical protein